MQDRSENRQARQAERAAFRFQPSDQVFFEQGIEDNTRRFFNLDQYAIKLLLGPNQWMHMLDRHDFGILRCCRASDRNQGLAGRVRDQMKVKIACRKRHRMDRTRWEKLSTTVQKAMAFLGVQAL